MQVVSFHQPKKPADLIRLNFSLDFLQVHQFRDVRMHKYVMASANAIELKAKSLHQVLEAIFLMDVPYAEESKKTAAAQRRERRFGAPKSEPRTPRMISRPT
jgi:hypothetical protein